MNRLIAIPPYDKQLTIRSNYILKLVKNERQNFRTNLAFEFDEIVDLKYPYLGDKTKSPSPTFYQIANEFEAFTKSRNITY